MSGEQPKTLSAWLTGLPIPWLVSNEVGHADAVAQGTVYDQQIDLAKQGVRARFPDYGPEDALPYIGHDRKLIQGFAESDDDFRVRLRTAWAQWALAGTWAELLFQLFWSCGFSTASTWIVQQNGYAWNLSADPGPDEDPLALLQVQPVGTSALITPPTPVPWWRFDDRVDLCSRFAVIVSGTLPGTIQVTGRATFTAADRATATWSGPLDNADYEVLVSDPVTSGAIPLVAVDEGSKTGTTADVTADAAFTGYVDLIAYQDGGNPFASPSQQTLNTFRKVVATWKPAKTKLMGLWVVIEGAVWGWPLGTKWGDAGLKWGAGMSAYFAP